MPDLTHPGYVAQILKTYGLYTRKYLGQHFLISRDVLDSIVEAADVKNGDIVLEVGAGIGTLTKALAERAGRVVVFEIDEGLRPVLAETLDGHANVRLYFDDVLQANVSSVLDGQQYKLVANLPYNAGTHILDVLLKSGNPPRSITVLLQEEVAGKMAAEPPHATYLSNFMESYGQVRIVRSVPPSAFFPPPQVDSAVLQANKAETISVDPKAFSRFLHRGFANPRKMINKSFSPQELADAGVDPARRPENLTFAEWLALFDRVYADRS